jgi:hypothetical protein
VNARGGLPLLAVVAAGLCIAELFWLRTAQFVPTPLTVGLLFLPWLLAAAANLGLWYVALGRLRPSRWRRASAALLGITSGAFGLAFAALYAGLIFGWFDG